MPGYQSAYKHCLIERQIMSVCNSLGIIFGRQIVGAEVDLDGVTVSIRPHDIAMWMGISPGQFATCRTELVAHEAQGLVLASAMAPHHHTLLTTLNSMMSGRVLSPVDPNGGYMAVVDLQAGDVNAVRMRIATLKSQVAEVRTLWGQYMS
ncbi:hypothetical protein C8R46DRAFT_1048236 [Mycena filopes]|nr:hypothetical protein C8R46DRAFT_1048236 [Mycena filopes]